MEKTQFQFPLCTNETGYPDKKNVLLFDFQKFFPKNYSQQFGLGLVWAVWFAARRINWTLSLEKYFQVIKS